MATSFSGISSARFLAIAKTFARRVPVGPRTKREILDFALAQLEEVAYTRLQSQGFCPNGIIDVGAHQGDWIQSIRHIFRDCPSLSIEAREEQREGLGLVCSKLPDAELAIALLGPTPKRAVQFHIHGSGSSLFSERSDAQRTVREMDMVTLDQVVSGDSRLKSPLLLKLDVQGAELEVLRGANETLARCEIVQLEIALLNYNDGAPTAPEVISFMDARGFAIFDVVGFVRPNGTDLVQVDLLFAKKTSALRRDYFHFDP
jgi:FkbM family methyltransferase